MKDRDREINKWREWDRDRQADMTREIYGI